MQIDNYEHIPFKDKPDLTTPIIAEALNHISLGVKQNRDYLIELNQEISEIDFVDAEGIKV